MPFEKKPKGWLFGNGGKFNGNPKSNFHAGRQPDRNELLSRRNRADEQMEADLLYRHGIYSEVRSFNDRRNYGIRIIVKDYTSAMKVQSIFSGEQMKCNQENGCWVVTLTE